MDYRGFLRHASPEMSSDDSMDGTMQDAQSGGGRNSWQPGITTDGMDPASPGGPSPFNAGGPTRGEPVVADPLWSDPEEPNVQGAGMPHIQGPNMNALTLHNARRSDMTIPADLWTEASTDHEAQLRAHRFTLAKVSAAEFWPFLAMARSDAEFGHRLALVHDDLTAALDADLHEPVLASLREDFRAVANGYGHDIDGWADRQREMYPEKYDPAGDYADGTKSRDEPRQRGTINGADIRDIQKHLPEGSPYRTSSLHEGMRLTASSGDLWEGMDAAPSHQQRLGARDDDEQEGATEDLDDEDYENTGRREGSRRIRFFHVARGEWVTAAAQDSPGNPYYPDPEPEVGPNQGQSGYANMAPDPPNTTLQQYDHATPAPWGDNTPWVDNEMQLSPGPSGGTGGAGWASQPPQRTAGMAHRAAPQEMGYWHDGTENPDYFADGTQGLTGGGVEGAPPPIQGNPDAGGVASGGPDGSTSAEPIEPRSDWYGEMTGNPQASPGVTERDGTEGQSFEPGTRRGASRAQALFDSFLAQGSRLPFV